MAFINRLLEQSGVQWGEFYADFSQESGIKLVLTCCFVWVQGGLEICNAGFVDYEWWELGVGAGLRSGTASESSCVNTKE